MPVWEYRGLATTKEEFAVKQACVACGLVAAVVDAEALAEALAEACYTMAEDIAYIVGRRSNSRPTLRVASAASGQKGEA